MKSNKEELFNMLINNSLKTLDSIIDPTEKVMAMAELAKAVAISGLFEPANVSINKEALTSSDKDPKTTTETQSIVKQENGIQNYKEEPVEMKERGVPQKEVREEAPVKEEVKEEAKEEVKEEAQNVETFKTDEVLPDPEIKEQTEPISAPEPEKRSWDKESVMFYKEEVAELKRLTDEIGVEEITKLVSDFSQGFLTKGLQEILPNNIEAFLTYVKKNLK